MTTKFFASLSLALALLTPACSAAASITGARHLVISGQPEGLTYFLTGNCAVSRASAIKARSPAGVWRRLG